MLPLLEAGNRTVSKWLARTPEARRPSWPFRPSAKTPATTPSHRHDIPKVVGGCSPAATELASAMYGAIFRRVVPVSSPSVAEMTKLLENIYRCVNIALVNELKQLCMRMGIDIHEVIDAAKTKPFGFQAFYPGPGLGGHCIPIDPFYLSWKAKQFDFRTRFIELAGEVNTAMPYFVIEQIADGLNDQRKSMKGSKVLVLGLAYKRDIDDLRESPSLTIIELLREKGAHRLLQRSLFSHGRPRPPLCPQHDQHPARRPRPVRRRGHCHRPLQLRLPRHRRPVEVGGRYPKRHQGHSFAQNCPLLIGGPSPPWPIARAPHMKPRTSLPRLGKPPLHVLYFSSGHRDSLLPQTVMLDDSRTVIRVSMDA